MADRGQGIGKRRALPHGVRITGDRQEHDRVAVSQVLVELLGDLLEPARGDVIGIPRGGQLHHAEARALAHIEGVEPSGLRIDEHVRADRDAESPRVTFHSDAPGGR